jgi:nitrous oxide reductase accessory protein NosL
MSEPTRPDRRQALKTIAATGLAGYAITRTGAAHAAACDGDGTPLQFVPKTKPDPAPLTDELAKYPKCPYCGMDRKQYHHSRHLIHYADDLVDGTCSLHCAAISLAINLDRGPKAIYAADFGSTAEVKPLVNVDQATYLIGSKLPGVMTAKSKKAFASGEAAAAAMKEHGGELGNFDAALAAAYASMAADTSMIRKKRAEKRAKMMEEKKG